MTNLKKIFEFGWPYLRRYRRRLFLGILLAVFFGASNASFVWATKTLFDRMAPKDPPPQVIVLNDFDWKSFVARLKNPAPADEISRYLMNEKLAPATRKLVEDDNGAVDLTLRQALADDLSGIIRNGPIYDPQRFVGVTISRDTGDMLRRNPKETADVARVNRKLLMDTYPKSMAPLAQAAQNLQRAANDHLDPWLPMRNRALDIRQIVGGLLLLPILVFFRSSVGYFSVYSMNWVSERVIKDLRLNLLIKLNSLSMDFFNRSTMGE
jgi:ABC-type multidrug transport system fused ATPase/permease subunit